ncbi:MAG: PIG-L family deacetylase [Deltaproteobacteria bacterium]|nr:PIG-L family deacetylase [Deltaproteobacteria bacterium]
MERRDFVRLTLAAGAGLAASPALVTGCASVPVSKGAQTIDDLLHLGPRVMWVAAHPDDEALVGAILARSSIVLGNPLYMLILTHGEGGECCRPEGCKPDLATVRAAEMKKVARLYRAELQHERFFNAPLPVESFPPRHEIAKRWIAKQDPTSIVAAAIRKFRPDILFTFDPDNGFTGHPEHQLASRFVSTGARLAFEGPVEKGGPQAHKITHVFYGLNRYWPFVLLGAADPGPVTDEFDATLPCVGGKTCRDVMGEISKCHRSQANDMGTVRSMKRWIDRIYLRRADPYHDQLDPLDPGFKPVS